MSEPNESWDNVTPEQWQYVLGLQSVVGALSGSQEAAARLREDHVTWKAVDNGDTCIVCYEAWPCDVMRVVEAVEVAVGLTAAEQRGRDG